MRNQIIPTEAGQGWTLELLELKEPVRICSTAERQWIIKVEGALKVLKENQSTLSLPDHAIFPLATGEIHTLIPEPSGRCLLLATPLDCSSCVPSLNVKYCGMGIVKGKYTVHTLIGGDATQQRWSTALVNIHDSPRHFHRIEVELFFVVNGTLEIEINGAPRILNAGEHITIYPGMVHRLTSASKEPVHVLCFNFPSFDPNDHHLI